MVIFVLLWSSRYVSEHIHAIYLITSHGCLTGPGAVAMKDIPPSPPPPPNYTRTMVRMDLG